MPNLAIHKKGSDDIQRFVIDCVQKTGVDRDSFFGSNTRQSGKKRALFDIKWTEDVATPIHDAQGNIIGYVEKVSELTEYTGEKAIMGPPSHANIEKAFRIRNRLSGLSYQQAETYIETNITDLASAKEFLKMLAKAVIALSIEVDAGGAG